MALIYGDNNSNIIAGTHSADIIYGYEGDDTIRGYRGDDEIHAGDGDDTVFGHQGNDVLYGGEGEDLLKGGEGDDILYGGEGNDRLIDQEGNDTLYGGAGNDTFISTDMSFTNDPGHNGGDFHDGGEGVDTIDYRGRAEGVHIDSNPGASSGHFYLVSSVDVNPSSVNLEDRLENIERVIGTQHGDAIAGADRVNDHFFDVGGVDAHFGNDSGVFHLQTGIDTIDYSLLNTSIYVNIDDDYRIAYEGYVATDFFNGVQPQHINPNSEIVVNFENVNGSHFDDVIIGSSGLNGSRDTESVGGFDVSAYAGGDNVINGNDGDDIIYGGVGDDIVRGGDGDDYIIGHFDTIDNSLFTYGTLASDFINDPGSDDDFLRGNDGNDHIEGRQGDDELRGDDGDDYLDGGLHNDILRGGQGADTLIGGEGDDVLRGDDGNDVLRGGAGDDELFGGGEGDVFVFEDGFGHDRVRDFGVGNTDFLDVSGWSFINDFSDVQANITQSGSFVSIWDTVNNDRLLLANTDVADIDASDFIFS